MRSRTVVIESRDGTLSLIPFSERGSAYEQQVPDRREMRAFVCRQFKKQDVLWASEIQSVRDFGSESATSRCRPKWRTGSGSFARTPRPPSNTTS
ncbi:major capsid protein [Paracoccus marcusii]|uniref:major capsid protein n=1 Tax=Paracoccus marcusii TaxID=59779 RepID=UPI0039C8704D